MRLETLALAAAVVCAVPSVAPAQTFDGPSRSGPYSLDLIDESGGVLPTFEHRGRIYVLGTIGERYLLRVRNESARRAEVVASVDGRDVIDGRPAAWQKRGYIVEPYGELVIDGYRTSEQAVAAFRFSTVPRSYAAQKGDARDVGVVGVAVFPERAPRYDSHPYRTPYGPPSSHDDRRPSQEAPPSGEARPGTAPSSPPPGGSALRAPERPREPHRSGLGTEFAEEHGSPVYQVSFERASARPDAVLTLRYNDREGLLALGLDVYRSRWGHGDEAWMRESADPFRRSSSYAEPPPGWRP